MMYLLLSRIFRASATNKITSVHSAAGTVVGLAIFPSALGRRDKPIG